MEMYKVIVSGKRLPKELKNKSFYFQEKRTASAYVQFFNHISNKFKCKVEKHIVLSHDEAFKQISQAYEVNGL